MYIGHVWLPLIQWIALTPFEQPGPGARSGKCYRRRGLRLTCLQDFFSIGGQLSCFYKSFSCDGVGGGRAVGVEGGAVTYHRLLPEWS